MLVAPTGKNCGSVTYLSYVNDGKRSTQGEKHSAARYMEKSNVKYDISNSNIVCSVFA